MGIVVAQVLSSHLLCAAAECPLGVPNLGDVNDAALFGGKQRLEEVIDWIVTIVGK